MSETADQGVELGRRKTAIAAFLASLMTSAKTSVLYKAGHPMIVQIADRMLALLQKTLGGEQTLTLEVKAKTVRFEDTPLPEGGETTAFATALHTLAVGGILFTNRINQAGMCELFRILTSKVDEKNTLADLQKALQSARIEGLQFNFILTFVSTGETETKEQAPGQLSEDQLTAFLKAESLPDFLTLLLHQSEDLKGKEAETVTGLLDRVLYREVGLERFEEAMPWKLYSPRIRERFRELVGRMAWKPKVRGRRASKADVQAWSEPVLASWAALYDEADLARANDHRIHEHRESLGWALEEVHRILDAPAAPSQPKFALATYLRVLRDLCVQGRVDVLLREFPRWAAMAKDPSMAKLHADFKTRLRDRLVNPIFTEHLAAHLGTPAMADPPAVAAAADLCLFLGPDLMPFLLEELRRLSDKDLRARFCAFLALVAKGMGSEHLLNAVSDTDWFLVVNVLGILSELGLPESVARVAPVLMHEHAKAREAAMKFLIKFGGPAAADGMARFVAETPHREDVPKAVIALSLLRTPGIEKRLLAAYPKVPDYETRVSLVRALGRFPGHEVIRFLKETSRRSWYEIFTGVNKELRLAAKHALEQLRKEGGA
ncbi:MAG: HEAT repeat domain-containing protein [Elusimicrobia bacterium]|nr:HEAT repeat domain-containing protein [Elusimicrobiota bacterium]